MGSKTMIQRKCSKMLNLLRYFGSPVEVFSAVKVYKECKQISFHFWRENISNLLRFGANNAQNQVLTFLAKNSLRIFLSKVCFWKYFAPKEKIGFLIAF